MNKGEQTKIDEELLIDEDDTSGSVWQRAKSAGGALLKKKAIKLLKPKLEPHLKKQGLEWSDVVPVLEEIDSVDEIKQAVADPESLLQRVAPTPRRNVKKDGSQEHSETGFLGALEAPARRVAELQSDFQYTYVHGDLHGGCEDIGTSSNGGNENNAIHQMQQQLYSILQSHEQERKRLQQSLEEELQSHKHERQQWQQLIADVSKPRSKGWFCCGSAPVMDYSVRQPD